MAESLVQYCVACNRQLDDSRERRVLLDRRTRHVLPYLNELAGSLDWQYDEFTRYSDMQFRDLPSSLFHQGIPSLAAERTSALSYVLS